MKCRLGAPTVVSHTLIDGYKLVNVGGHFTCPSHYILSPHLIGSIIYLSLFFTHTWENAVARVLDCLGFPAQKLTSVDHPKISLNFDLINPHFLAQKSRLDVDFDLAALTFLLLLFALIGTTLTFVDFRFTNLAVREGCVTLLVG